MCLKDCHKVPWSYTKKEIQGSEPIHEHPNKKDQIHFWSRNVLIQQQKCVAKVEVGFPGIGRRKRTTAQV